MNSIRLAVRVVLVCATAVILFPDAAPASAYVESTAPTIGWATYMGGTLEDLPLAMAVDRTGNVFIGGHTSSPNFPIVNSASVAGAEGSHAFFAKISPAGAVVWATCLAGNGDDTVGSVALDRHGDLVATCITSSTDLPVVKGFQKHSGGETDSFVLKLSGEGRLLWSTYMAGDSDDVAQAMAVDLHGNIVIAGTTRSTSFLGHRKQTTDWRDFDCFAVKLTPGGRPIWTRRFGGTRGDVPLHMAIDAAGSAVILGDTDSTDFPMVRAFQQTPASVFITALSASGRVLWSSYLGGSVREMPEVLALDRTGDIFVGGATFSPDFPTPGGLGTSFSGIVGAEEGDGFVAKITAKGKLVWGRYLGGSRDDSVTAMAMYPDGGCLAGGYSYSPDFPNEGEHVWSSDCFAARLAPSGELTWIRNIGGHNTEDLHNVAVDPLANAYLVGATTSDDFPAFGGFDSFFWGWQDAFVGQLTPEGKLTSLSLFGVTMATVTTAAVVDGDGVLSLAAVTGSDNLPAVEAFQALPGGGRDAYMARIDFHAPLFAVYAPEPGEHVTGVPTFRFAMQSGIRKRRIAFCANEDFGATSGAKVVKAALKADMTSWTPRPRQWRALKNLAQQEGTLYWRLEGLDLSGAAVQGPGQSVVP